MKKVKELQTHLRQRLKSWSDALDAETEERSRNREAGKYDRTSIRVAMGLVMLLTVGALYQKVSYSERIADKVKNESQRYRPVSTGYLFRSEGYPPFNAAVRKTKLELPDRRGALAEFLREDGNFPYWYEFKVSVPDSEFQPGRLGILIPLVWGHSRLYVNGEWRDFGQDHSPILPLFVKETLIHLQVDPNGQAKSGIRAFFPLILGAINDLRALPKILELQRQTYTSAETVNLIALFIFSIFFVFSSQKPELFIFGVFLIANLAYGKVWDLNQDNILILSPSVDRALLAGLSFLRSFLLFWFLLEYFRLLHRRIIALGKVVVVWTAAFVVVVSLLFRVAGRAEKLEHSVELAQELAFLFATCVVTGLVTYYLYSRNKPRRRIIASALLCCAVFMNFGLNAYDFLYAKEMLTNEFIHNIGMVFLLIAIVAAEFARSERERGDLLLNFPKEAQESFIKGQGQGHNGTHRGILVLVDGIGWTKYQERLASPEDEALFQDRINRYLMETFSHRGTSILQGTGDGFYFAWEGELSVRLLQEILGMVGALLDREVPLTELGIAQFGSEATMRFRAALTYGEYAVGRSRFRELTRDFAASRQLSRLARVCGGGNVLRILYNDKMGCFEDMPGRSPLWIEDKHGLKHKCFEFTAEELRSVLKTSENLCVLARRTAA